LTHAEEIAFYNGSDWERANIDQGFKNLFNHVSYVLNKKFWMGIFDSMLVKYGAVMIGYTVVGLPVFGPNSAKYLAERGDNQATITKDYVRNSSLLINLAKAIGRLVVSYPLQAPRREDLLYSSATLPALGHSSRPGDLP